MALNSSGPISIAGTTAGVSIQTELGGTGSTQMGLNCASVRTLAGVPTGAIVMPTCFYGKSNTVPFGCATYTTNGTYTFTVPSGVSKISVVCVGGGGNGCGGDDCSADQGGGGPGGGLAYSNCIPVTSGESLTVGVGGNTYLNRGATKLVGVYVCWPASVRYAGGVGGACGCKAGGGGGAGGYAGNGGKGEDINNCSTPGSGGGGGGGCSFNGGGGSGGGGVGLVVQGPSGSAGNGGGGGSGGSSGSSAGSGPGGPGGAYGGGGGGESYRPQTVGSGAQGGLRIIYGGTGKSYPTNSAP